MPAKALKRPREDARRLAPTFGVTGPVVVLGPFSFLGVEKSVG
jgi:hypothetical protein